MVVHKGEEFEAIIVSRKNYKERDMLVKMYTSRFGFKTFFIRGVRKRGFKHAAAILPYTKGKYVGDVSETGLSFMNNATEMSQWQNICQDIMLNAYASYILELAQYAFYQDDQTAIFWYPQIKQALELIDQGLDPQIIVNLIEVQLLPYFGASPQLTHCVFCEQASGRFDFSESYGGIICEKHFANDSHRLHLDQRTIYFLRMFSQVDLMQVNSINLKEETKNNLQNVLENLYENVGVYPKAKRFIKQMQNMKY